MSTNSQNIDIQPSELEQLDPQLQDLHRIRTISNDGLQHPYEFQHKDEHYNQEQISLKEITGRSHISIIGEKIVDSAAYDIGADSQGFGAGLFQGYDPTNNYNQIYNTLNTQQNHNQLQCSLPLPLPQPNEPQSTQQLLPKPTQKESQFPQPQYKLNISNSDSSSQKNNSLPQVKWNQQYKVLDIPVQQEQEQKMVKKSACKVGGRDRSRKYSERKDDDKLAEKERLLRKIKQQEDRLNILKTKLYQMIKTQQIKTSGLNTTTFSQTHPQKQQPQLQYYNQQLSPTPQPKPQPLLKLQPSPKLITQEQPKPNPQPQVPSHDLNPEQQLFSLHKQAYIDCQKAIFIIQEIIDPIESQQMLSYKDEKHVEFMFLVTSRAYNYLQSSMKTFKNTLTNSPQPQPQGHPEQPLASDPAPSISSQLQNQLQNLIPYLHKSKIKHKIYSQMIDELRSKIRQKLSKLFHLNKSVDGKEKYLDGFEGLDYKSQEQVQFTYRNYVEIVLNSKEFKSQYFVNHRLKKVLRGYKRLCAISQADLDDQKQFKTLVNQIIIDQ